MIKVIKVVSINFERSIRRPVLSKRMVTSCARLLLFVRNSGPSELSQRCLRRNRGLILTQFNRVSLFHAIVIGQT